MTPTNRILYVHAQGNPSNPEDDDIAGLHVIVLEGDVPEDALANAALDVFHGHIGVETLDDFEFSVLDRNGKEILPSEDYEDYEFVDNGTPDGKEDPAALGIAADTKPTI